MYQIWQSSITVPVHMLHMLDYDYSVDHPNAVKILVDEFPTLQSAQKTLELTVNNLVQYDKHYTMYEYYLTDEKEILAVNDQFLFKSERDKYHPKEVHAMQALLDHLGFYVKLASVIVYERYGFLYRQLDGGKDFICYKDERQKILVCPDTPDKFEKIDLTGRN